MTLNSREIAVLSICISFNLMSQFLPVPLFPLTYIRSYIIGYCLTYYHSERLVLYYMGFVAAELTYSVIISYPFFEAVFSIVIATYSHDPILTFLTRGQILFISTAYLLLVAFLTNSLVIYSGGKKASKTMKNRLTLSP